MRIATYNLFEGAQDTYPLVKEFTASQNLDVLCLQEANRWQDGNPNRLQDFAASTGLNHFVFGDSNTRFKLATFSRAPFVQSKVRTKDFWHSAIESTVLHEDRPLTIWNVHLNPQDEDSRLVEACVITEAISKNGLVMGDLNSLSKQDAYPDSLLIALQKRDIQKFGKTALRYEVTDHFAQEGLTDVAAATGTNRHTVPTPANRDMFHAEKMRLDYMFATQTAMANVQDIEVVDNDLTKGISDHYPLVITLG